MKILLVSIDVAPGYTAGLKSTLQGAMSCYYSIGVLKAYAMKDALISKHCKILTPTYPAHKPAISIANHILDQNPQIVGFSSYIWNHGKIMKIVQMLKRARRDLKIILGGAMIPTDVKDLEAFMTKNSSVDIAVVGEGELTFHELIRNFLTEQKRMDEILGIAFRRDGQVMINERRPYIDDLSTVPSPYLTGAIKLKKGSQGLVIIETSRGCPNSCAYCQYHGGSRYRPFPLERVEKELQYCIDHDFQGTLYVADSILNLDMKRAKEILRMLSKCNFPINLELRPELIDDEMIQLLAKLPKSALHFGIQSTHEEALRNINRRMNIQECTKVFKKISQYPNINACIELILGLPGDNYETFKKSVDWAVSCNLPYPNGYAFITNVQIFDLMLLENSPLMKMAEKFKMKYVKSKENLVTQNYSFSPKGLIKGSRLRTMLNSLSAPCKKTFRLILETTGLKPSEILERLADVAIKEGKLKRGRLHEYEFLYIDNRLFKKFLNTIYRRPEDNEKISAIFDLFRFEKFLFVKENIIDRTVQALEKYGQDYLSKNKSKYFKPTVLKFNHDVTALLDHADSLDSIKREAVRILVSVDSDGLKFSRM